ncbi:Ion channel [Ancylostoma caninum]|uniref:Ion channel n=1 Tax=Ancylostoma caninum TaxID=29170 RepID=A0A368F416_ANCCA|nr:Ion channel [Ancylostoma caninum]
MPDLEKELGGTSEKRTPNVGLHAINVLIRRLFSACTSQHLEHRQYDSDAGLFWIFPHRTVNLVLQKCALQYAKRILPHVGLVCLLFAYLLIGATIFHAIEGPNELVQRDYELRTIFGLRDDFQDHIWNITQDIDNRISREAFNSINQEYFEQLVKNIFVSYRNQFINENHLMNKTNGEGLLWTYPNSIFFATTVITTIGYGNLVPTTTSGRIACIIFALFGIPLLLVTIADIGKFLSEFLSFLYKSYRAFKRKVSE